MTLSQKLFASPGVCVATTVALAEQLRAVQVTEKKVIKIKKQMELGSKLPLTENTTLVHTEIANKTLSHAVVLLVNTLKNEGEMKLLDLPTHELFDHKTGPLFRAHPSVYPLAKKFMDKASIEAPTYWPVVSLAQTLKHEDVYPMSLYLSSERLRTYQDGLQQAILKAEKERALYEVLEVLEEKEAKDFQPGDFRFIAEPNVQRWVHNAYHYIQDKNAWVFKETPPELLADISKKDGHTLFTLSFVKDQLQMIKDKGWTDYVAELLVQQRREQEKALKRSK